MIQIFLSNYFSLIHLAQFYEKYLSSATAFLLFLQQSSSSWDGCPASNALFVIGPAQAASHPKWLRAWAVT